MVRYLTKIDCTLFLSFLVPSNWETVASGRYSRAENGEEGRKIFSLPHSPCGQSSHSSLARSRESRSPQSLNYWEKRNGLRAVYAQNQSLILASSRCYSNVGRSGGEQIISIGDGCERLGTVQHEILHATGFIHEQSRPDRDDYVEVIKQNINPSRYLQISLYSILLPLRRIRPRLIHWWRRGGLESKRVKSAPVTVERLISSASPIWVRICLAFVT